MERARRASGLTFLVVEDEPDLLRLVAWMLGSAWPGATVRTAPDGRRGAQRLKDLKPDLLVTDLKLPGMSGIELCRLAREDPRLSRTRILAMTAYDSPAISREALESGADEYLAKPFSAEELRRATSRLMSGTPVERRWRPRWQAARRGPIGPRGAREKR